MDRPRAFALCVLTLFLCDCDDQSLGPATVERHLIAVSGSGQPATATLPVPQPLVVSFEERTVRSGSSGGVAGPWTGVSGVSVSWSSAEGGTFNPATSTTDASGKASTIWTPARNSNLASSSSLVDARVAVLGGFATTFSIRFVDPVIEVSSGDGQTGRGSSQLPNPLVAIVRTAPELGGAPLANQSVTWTTFSSFDGTVTSLGGQTNAQGLVTARWTLGTARNQSLQATVTGPAFSIPRSRTFRATALFTNLKLQKASGDSQVVAALQPLRDSVVVVYTATDEATNITRPVAGAAVTWLVISAPGTPNPGAVTPGSSITDAQGRAWARWTLGSTSGQQTLRALTAHVDSAGPTSVFEVDFVAFAGTTRMLRVVSGNSQSAQVGTLLPGSLVVEYVDLNPATGATTPVPNTTVTWTVQSGGGSLNPVTGITDALGRVSTRWTLGSPPGTQMVRASVPAAQAPPGSIVNVDFSATATSTPTPARVAYAVVDPAANVDPAYTFNSRSGGLNTATHTGLGSYRVVFGAQATPAGGKETVQVTSHGNGSAYCKLGSTQNVGADLEVTVNCYTPGATRSDGGFSILLLDNTALSGRYAFALADQPSTSSYTPANAFTTRQPITITRLGTGDYNVQFAGSARAPGDAAEAIMMTAAGNSGYVCSLDGAMVSATVRVHCWLGFDDLLTQHQDQQFSIALIERGRANARAATAWVQKARSPSTRTLPADSASSTAGTVGVQRMGSVGLSVVTFKGLGRLTAAARENIQLVGAEDEDASYCKIVGWNSVSAGSSMDLQVTVQCWHEDGGLDDLSFYIIVIE